MRITKKSAQQIVEEIGKLVRQNINLMDDISRDRKQAYLKRIFRDCGSAEIAEQVSLLEAFFSAEGSVQAIAAAKKAAFSENCYR